MMEERNCRERRKKKYH